MLNYVPRVSLCPTCLTCLRALRVCVSYVLYAPASHFLRALRFLIFLRALRAFIFYLSYVPLFFHVPYVPSFFTCLIYPHFIRALRALIVLRALCASTFLSVSNFWRALYAFIFFIKCGTTHNQPQQAGISKKEVE